jgi:hypothetical protein
VTYRAFTLVLPFYMNQEMFREQQRQMLALTPDIRAALHVVAVDDGSPTAGAVSAVLPEFPTAVASFRLFRTGVDVRWNWIFCRNLGVEQATTEWVLMTDMDHVVPQLTWRRLMRGKLDPLCAYRLSRVVAPDLTSTNPHPNTWIMTRHMFRHRIGGYDERFSGYYGSDGQFHKRVAAWARVIHILPEVAVVYPDTVIADACTTTYERKTPQDREQRHIIKGVIHGLGDKYAPKRLSFPWTRVL